MSDKSGFDGSDKLSYGFSAHIIFDYIRICKGPVNDLRNAIRLNNTVKETIALR